MDKETFDKTFVYVMGIIIFSVILPVGFFAPMALWIVIPVLIIVVGGGGQLLQNNYDEKHGIARNSQETPYVFPKLELSDSWKKILDELIAEFIINNEKTKYMKYLDNDFLAEMTILSKKHRLELNIKNFDENVFVNDGDFETENLSEEEEEFYETTARMMTERFNNNQSGYEDYIEKMAAKYKEKMGVQSKEIIENINKIMSVSTKIQISMMRNMLKMDEYTFDRKILDWAVKFNFKIDGEYIIIEDADIKGFIDDLDNQFKIWDNKDKK